MTIARSARAPRNGAAVERLPWRVKPQTRAGRNAAVPA
jgi:hypothetical protein